MIYRLIFIGLVGVLLTACSLKKEPKPEVEAEHNVTVHEEITASSEVNLDNCSVTDNSVWVEEPVTYEETYSEEPVVMQEEQSSLPVDEFEWQQNDEFIQDGVVSRVIVVKSKRVLVLVNKEGDVLSRHRISLGEHPVGAKLQHGDKKTPEGIYKIIDKRSDKKYYKEMLLNYPNAEDRRRARAMGVSPGSGITIHAQVPWNWGGVGDDYTLSHDWTNGCMAMTNRGMDMVWNMIPLGTIVEIRE